MILFESWDDIVGREPRNNPIQPSHFTFVELGKTKEEWDTLMYRDNCRATSDPRNYHENVPSSISLLSKCHFC